MLLAVSLPLAKIFVGRGILWRLNNEQRLKHGGLLTTRAVLRKLLGVLVWKCHHSLPLYYL